MKKVLALAAALCLLGAFAQARAERREFTGEYFGYSHDEKIKVTLVTEDWQTVEIRAEGPGETPEIGGKALDKLVEYFNKGGDVDFDLLDAVSGATRTFDGFLLAKYRAEKASGIAFDKMQYQEGFTVHMEGEGPGYISPRGVQLTVTLTQGKIEGMEWAYQEGDPEYARQAMDDLGLQAYQRNSARLDVVAGATWTSVGFIIALRQALDRVGFEGETAAVGVYPALLAVRDTRDGYVFRSLNWGDGSERIAEVLDTPLDIRVKPDDTSLTLLYPIRLSTLDLEAGFEESGDGLRRITYLWTEALPDAASHLKDYALLGAALAETYGGPVEELLSWKDDAARQGFENRRAEALAQGLLRFDTLYVDGDTVAYHSLYLEAGNIRQSLELYSLALNP